MDSQQVNESYLAGYLNSAENGNIKSGQLAGAPALGPHPTHFSFCFVLLFEAGSHGIAMADLELNCIDQAGLGLREIHMSLPPSAEIKGMLPTPSPQRCKKQGCHRNFLVPSVTISVL